MCKFKFHILVFLCIWGTIYSRLSAEPRLVIKPTADALCTANPFISFMIDFEDDGSFGTGNMYIFEFSVDGANWTQIGRTSDANYGYTQRPTNLQEGWYRLSAARLGEESQPDLWISSEPVYMEKIEGGCTPFRNPWDDEISDDVCPRGTILFREDFGGNDPSDPITSPDRLTTMSTRYRQAFNVISRVYSGLFVVAKHGWQNNLQTSATDNLHTQWFIQDDHTYPNDYSRGYLLEVDGIGGNDAFYTTTFPVCHELDLSFSAYVANVLEPGHDFARPRVRFLIQNEETNDTIWEQSTGKIEPAPRSYREIGIPITMSAPWHLVGASFHVPEGVSTIRLSIFNDENSGGGNDFAMDDIEIRLCKPEVSILSDHEICMDSSYIFEATVTADGGFREPYNYLWQYAPDSLPFNSDEWTNVGTGLDLSFDSVKLSDTGWYRLCVTSDGIDVETERYCRAMSEPFHLIVKDCTPPCPELIEEFDEILICDTLLPYRWHDTVFYSDTTYEIISYNKYGCEVKKATYTLRTEVCCYDLKTAARDTVVCDTLMPFTWRGLLFTEPGEQKTMEHDRRGCDSLETTWTLTTEVCCPPLKSAEMDTVVCDTLMPFTWRGLLFTEPGEQKTMEYDRRGCDSLETMWTLSTEVCCPPLKSAEMDTVVCDTLMPFTWRGLLFTEPGEQITMERDARGCDILQTTWTLSTELCCPDWQYAPVDTVVCDTLMPFTWNGILFTEPSVQEVMELSPRGCDSILHIYTLDTVHCERLYPIIVNKYNWQLLCDNIVLHRLFPEQMPLAFQWYKDEAPVFGANEDDYAEQNELHGVFQLRVTLSGDQIIWSNILEILDEIEEKPIQMRIYNSRGEEVTEDQVTHGVYLYRYEQGDAIWTEKRLIP